MHKPFPSSVSAREINRLGGRFTLNQHMHQSFINEYTDMDPIARAVYNKVLAEEIAADTAALIMEKPECTTFRRKTKKPDKDFLRKLRTEIRKSI